MNGVRVVVGAIVGGIGGAIVEAVLVMSVLDVFRDVYSQVGVSNSSLPSAGVPGVAVVEGLVAGMVAGAVSGAVGCSALLIFIAAAIAGFASNAIWLVGGAAGGLLALIAVSVVRLFEEQSEPEG